MPDSVLAEAQVEHDGAKELILQLRHSDVDDFYFDAKVKVLSEYIRHHVQEEEAPGTGILDVARKAGVDMEALGRRISEAQQDIAERVRAEGRPAMPSHGHQGENPEESSMHRQYESRYDEDNRHGRRMPRRDEEGRFVSDDDRERSRYEDHDRERRYSRSRHDDDDRGRYSSHGSRYSYDDDYRGRRMPRRDDEGRFVSDDDRGRYSSHGGRYSYDDDYRGRRMPRRDEEGRFVSDDDRDRSRYDDDRGRYSGRGGRYDDDGSEDHGQGGWFGDPEGHARAARQGWRNR